MLVSVCESKANPYFNLMEEQASGMLVKSKAANFVTRQAVPKVYKLNGAIYLISVASLLSKPIAQFETIAKYVMSKEDSIDIDDQKDWDYATYLIENSKQGH
jgi:N-acylneuraminate cytidylyltransferase